MKKLLATIILIVAMSGCVTVKDLWKEHKGAIVNKVVEVLEDEKVERKAIDKVIERLKKIDGIAPINS